MLQTGQTTVSPLMRGTLFVDAALELGGAAILLSAAVDYAARGAVADFAVSLLLAGVFLAAAAFIGALVWRPRIQPIGAVMILNAASGLVAFMLIAAGQVQPESSVPLVAATGALLLSLAGLLFLELRKVPA
jgi:hypothetical protein